MAFVPHPHTSIMVRTAKGPVLVARKGHLSVPAAVQLAAQLGGTGAVVVRHHGPALFGKPAPVLAIYHEAIRR